MKFHEISTRARSQINKPYSYGRIGGCRFLPSPFIDMAIPMMEEEYNLVTEECRSTQGMKNKTLPQRKTVHNILLGAPQKMSEEVDEWIYSYEPKIPSEAMKQPVVEPT
jgi:hypothetical protein